VETQTGTPGSDVDFARETGELTARRWKIGYALYLIFAAVGVLFEWRYYPWRAVPLQLAFLGQVAVVGVGWMSFGRAPRHPRSAWCVLGCNIAIPVILALYNAHVGGDLLYVLLTYLAIMFASSVFIPWGARFQLALSCGVIGAHTLARLGGARVGPMPAYDYIAIVATLVFSTLGALYIDQYRRRLYEHANALSQAYRQLRVADRARTELLSGLSHDMRTPLGVLIGYADMLSEAPTVMNDVSGPVRSIQREARQLLSLVDGVLSLARLEAGRLPFEPSEFGLAEILDPLRETTREMLTDGRVQLHWAVPAALVVNSDPSKVREIVRNLLSNAVKYTPQGQIDVTAAPAAGGTEIAVADTGVGIAPEHRELIFDAFHQIAPGSDQSRSGLGFGLYMVKLLVSLAGGRIDLQTSPGAGSTFRVWLPAQPPMAQ
jgi:signal transduction histidine kinase